MTSLYVVLALVTLQRLGELAYASRNTKRLLLRGASEFGASQYPFFILLHGAWLLTLALTIPRDARPNFAVLTAFALLQGVRLWIVFSLGSYWTTRVITLAGAPLVSKGPYRYLRHPNYAVVVAEIALLPLAFGAVTEAVVFSLLNGILLAWRISIEESALASRRRNSSAVGACGWNVYDRS